MAGKRKTGQNLWGRVDGVTNGIEPSFGLLLQKSLANILGQLLQEVFKVLHLAVGGDAVEDVPATRPRGKLIATGPKLVKTYLLTVSRAAGDIDFARR